jgi:hypothetical protein
VLNSTFLIKFKNKNSWEILAFSHAVTRFESYPLKNWVIDLKVKPESFREDFLSAFNTPFRVLIKLVGFSEPLTIKQCRFLTNV